MPTVLRLSGLRVAIYPNDHRPAHVHVIGSGQEAVFYLNCMEGPASLRENFGFALQEVNAIQKALQVHIAQLCKEWEKLHGHP